MLPTIERNNRAISCMERRDFSSAITLMNESIWILKEDGSDHDLLPLVPSLQHQDRADTAAGAPSPCDSCFSGNETPAQAPTIDPNRKNLRQKVILEDEISIFQFPLRIDPSTIIADDTRTEICAILAYNCALAHHLNGVELESNEARNAMLKQALALYQTAHSIHMQQASVEDTDVSFTLAVLNNVGQIQGLMGNMQASSRCFHRMLRILMLVVSQTEECAAETDLFFGNCSRFVLAKPAAPAA